MNEPLLPSDRYLITEVDELILDISKIMNWNYSECKHMADILINFGWSKKEYKMDKEITGNPGKNETCEHVWVMQLPKNEYVICKYCEERRHLHPYQKKESPLTPYGEALVEELAKVIENTPFIPSGFGINIAKHLISQGWSKKEGKDG